MSEICFKSEFDLEELVWKHLEPLLQLHPLARQYATEGQVCDVLAIDVDRQLVVIELKNVEDRYVRRKRTFVAMCKRRV